MRLRHWIVSLSILGSSTGGWARGATTDRWVTFRHDYQRTGRTTLVGPQSLDVVKWRQPVAPGGSSQGFVRGSPSIGLNGEVYVTAIQQGAGSVSTYLASFAPNGALRWQASLGNGQSLSSPSLADDDTLYVGAGSGVMSFRPDGNLFWASIGLTTVLASPALYRLSPPNQPQKMVVYVGTHDGPGVFYALDAIDRGNQLWNNQQVTGAIDSSPAVGSDGTLYFGSQGNGGSLNAVDPSTGEARWPAIQTDGAVEAAPAVSPDGTLYAAGLFGVLYSVNSRDGSIRWQWPGPSDGPVGQFFSSPALGSDGTIYIGSDDDRLYAVTPAGALKWAFDTGSVAGETGGSIFSSPAVGGDGTIYFGCDNGRVYALNPDGTLKSRHTIPTQPVVQSSPAIGPDGTLYIGADDGYLYAFQAHAPLPGDLNQDGRVNVADAQIALNLVVNPSKITPALLKIGDVYPAGAPGGPYGDGVIDISDVIRILQRAVGILATLP